MAPDSVKPRRRYDSPRRREQAAATRRAILEAAQRLFERDGYAPTTMAAIALEAGVAQKTVYVAFETKAGLLRALWHLRLRGDADPVPMTRRPWYREVLSEPDPVRRLAMTAAVSREVKERAGGVMAVIRAAADADPDMAGLWETVNGEFHGLLRGVVDSIDAVGALAPGLDAAMATDVLWALVHPDLWQLLVVGRGWSPARYEAWLAAALARELLGRAPGDA
jgi:AcrR family transcriptional regulator